jgi:hypothetical protein
MSAMSNLKSPALWRATITVNSEIFMSVNIAINAYNDEQGSSVAKQWGHRFNTMIGKPRSIGVAVLLCAWLTQILQPFAAPGWRGLIQKRSPTRTSPISQVFSEEDRLKEMTRTSPEKANLPKSKSRTKVCDLTQITDIELVTLTFIVLILYRIH